MSPLLGRKDRNIVIQAVSNYWNAIQVASEELKNDDAIADAVFEAAQDEDVIGLRITSLRRAVLGSSRGPCYQRDLPLQGIFC